MAASITVVCPECNNRMRASARHVGRQGRCPVCKALVTIQPAGDETSMASLYLESGVAQQEQRAALGVTDVPLWLSGLIGTAAAAVLLLATFPFRESPFFQLFFARGVVPYFVVLATCWGLAILVLKYLAVNKQLGYAEAELELIPLEIGMQITPANVDQFLGHMSQLESPKRSSIIGRRIQGALQHFRARNNVPEVQQYLATQAEIDASQIDSGYTLLRAFIWAIPILGFIGTVIGIGAAVSGLETSLSDTAGGTALQGAMKEVTAGLATAFDTTLVALCMAIVLLFPTEWLRKTEYGMLDRVQSFANESLLRRLTDDDTRRTGGEMPEIVRNALEAAFKEHQKWLAQWQAQVARLGEVIGADFESMTESVQKKLTEVEASRLDDLRQLVKAIQEANRDGGRSSDPAASDGSPPREQKLLPRRTGE